MEEILNKTTEQGDERKVKTRIMLFGGGFGHIGDNLAEVLKDTTIFSSRVELTIHAYNTDKEDLDSLHESIQKFRIGDKVARGFGAGADPANGRKAAEENKADILRPMEDADIVIMCACLGGGTGTGALPYAARQFAELVEGQEQKDLPDQKAGMIIVTMPFSSQDYQIHEHAVKAFQDLLSLGVSVSLVPNDKFLPKTDEELKKLDFNEMFELGNRPIGHAISRMVRALGKRHDRWNIDRNDIVSQLILPKGAPALAYFGVGYAREGEDISVALKAAAENPYLETNLWSCDRAILSVDATKLTAYDFQEIQKFTKGPEPQVLGAKPGKGISWRTGINTSFTPFDFEKAEDYKAAVFIIGTSCQIKPSAPVGQALTPPKPLELLENLSPEIPMPTTDVPLITPAIPAVPPPPSISVEEAEKAYDKLMENQLGLQLN